MQADGKPANCGLITLGLGMIGEIKMTTIQTIETYGNRREQLGIKTQVIPNLR